MISEVAKLLHGGGGKPQLATAGGKDASKLPEAIEQFKTLVQSALN